MPVRRDAHDTENSDLIEFIRAGSHRVGQAIEIPTVQGRSMAGWVPVQYKVPPEQAVMFDQLREHPFFTGRWKTAAQVAWSVTFLGLQALTKFIDTEDGRQWRGWQQFKSNYMLLSAANDEWSRVKKQEALIQAASKYKRTIHSWLDKGTAYGKYAAFKTLLKALASRDVSEDVRAYDEAMLLCEQGANVALVWDQRASDLWRRCVPSPMSPVNQSELDALNVEMCQPYYDELHAVGSQDDDEPE